MILPPRGTPVDTNRRAELRQALNPHEVVQRIDNLIQLDQVRLTEIFSDDDVHQRSILSLRLKKKGLAFLKCAAW